MPMKRRRYWRICQACHEPYKETQNPFYIEGPLHGESLMDTVRVYVCRPCFLAYNVDAPYNMILFMCERLDECLSRKETS